MEKRTAAKTETDRQSLPLFSRNNRSGKSIPKRIPSNARLSGKSHARVRTSPRRFL
jgi:hypothetical protein